MSGRLIEHDVRSRRFVAAGARRKRTTLHGYSGPVLDQKDSNSCCGMALAHFLNSDHCVSVRDSRFLVERDAFDFYSLGTRLDQWDWEFPPNDRGSSGIGVAKAGVRRGYLSSYGHAFGFDGFCRVVQTQPVLVGTWWFEGMYWPDSDGFVHASGKKDIGHEYLAVGVDYEAKFFTFLNSWGTNWGQGGFFKIGFDVFKPLLADFGDVVVPKKIR